MISFRTDDEMFHSLKALSQISGVDTSTIARLALATLLFKARKLESPITYDDLEKASHAELAND